MDHQTIVVAGNDPRERYLVQLLQAENWAVRTWAFPVEGCSPWDETSELPPESWIIGPMDGITTDGKIRASEGEVTLTAAMLRQIGRVGGGVAAGLIAPDVVCLAQELGVRTVVYRHLEEFAWLNAVPTAEGAIQAAIGLNGFGLAGREVAVLGFGHVGSVLALRLDAYGARVRVLDSSSVRRSQAAAFGLSAFPLEPASLASSELVFNTIPVPVVSLAWLSILEKTHWLEIASPPGGLQSEVRRRVRVLDLPGLPGRVTPRRAAEIIWQCLHCAGFQLQSP